jgi:hypothetical protein
MIQNVIRTLGGIDNYGVISLCLFCLIFTLVLAWTFMQRKPYLERMSRIPLESDSNDLNSRKDRHE